ncbi:sugar phosphate isomerase/epimerase [Orenia metallireducens]|jgi:sugar phosphate isomerase/epimerase|uniref:Sugar phosphate isomerase/epimerase n=1 Tax=Orenia metallireducens TaxID=1413210 RepID=A0A285HWJ7_9FIRM|nr:sugar phosphate isomerase/epimerase family protein [Orenia metallireducens]PRX29352.1 sugar phosphate isomerase/epimerase [Orenia metallireducens]SNY40080.1 Sugar phosphate isomerase/epimerase [Orenia metallireducens]
MSIKLAFSTLACPEYNINEIVKIAKNAGYSGVELRSYGVDNHIDITASQEKREEVRKKFEENNIDICCLAGYTRFDTKDQLEKQIAKLKELIKLASDLNVPYIRTFGGQVSLIQEAFNQVAEVAEEFEVKILLETHDILSRGEEIVKVFDKVDSDYFGVIWDVKHTVSAGESLEETIGYLKDYIYHVHIKDWISVPDYVSVTNQEAGHLVLLGAGELQIDKIIELLNDISYDGYLSLEWEKPWLPEIEESDIALYQYALKLKELL